MDTIGPNKDTPVTDDDMGEGTNPTSEEGEKEEEGGMPMTSSVGADEEDDEEGENSNDNVM